jgi:hypothetical protein
MAGRGELRSRPLALSQTLQFLSEKAPKKCANCDQGRDCDQ